MAQKRKVEDIARDFDKALQDSNKELKTEAAAEAPPTKPEDYPTYSPSLELDEDGKPLPPAIQERNPHGNLEWSLKEIKQDRGKLRMRFADWHATIVAYSENGVSSGKMSNKTYLRLEEIKDSKHYTIRQFIDSAKVLMDQIIWLSRYEVVKYQQAIQSTTGKSLPAIAIDPLVPCSQEYWDGNIYYSCFPNPEKTQAYVFDCRSEHQGVWSTARELGVNRFLMVSGNSNFKVSIAINSAEFFYDKSVNAIKFTWWPQVQVVTHFNRGQDVMYRPPKKDKVVAVNPATELYDNTEIAKTLGKAVLENVK